jgi:hypothetical protein
MQIIKKSSPNIPVLVRQRVFSYFDLGYLLNNICKLSEDDRKSLIESDIMDQKRNLVLDVSELSKF